MKFVKKERYIYFLACCTEWYDYYKEGDSLRLPIPSMEGQWLAASRSYQRILNRAVVSYQ